MVPDTTRQQVIAAILNSRDANGYWRLLAPGERHYPACLHYLPMYRASLWNLVFLADLRYDRRDPSIGRVLRALREHFFDPVAKIYSLGADHFPIPCLNGNLIYLDAYFGGGIGAQSRAALEFFAANQRFDDGEYRAPKSVYCKNTSCYGKHTCYWGVVKLFKGISFIPKRGRSASVQRLARDCAEFILLHRVCFSSRRPGRLLLKDIDRLAFPNMYKADFLEILWLLARERISSDRIRDALGLLRDKRLADGAWPLDKKPNHLNAGVGPLGKPNLFVTERARFVTDTYSNLSNV